MLIASLILLRERVNVITAKWHAVMKIAADPYRPELHYMRGRGPKWYAKQRPTRPEMPDRTRE